MSQKHLTNQRFTDLDLSAEQLRAIAEAGFEFLTPIQAKVLPLLLQQQDVAGQAQTGTGKTAAFLIAMFARLQEAEGGDLPRALILAPTRELAIQIYKDAQALAKHLPYRLVLAYGGTGYETQRRELSKGFDVLIGTPGRIIDYFKQGVFALSGIEVMILDEADRMFDLGFIKDIRFLLRRMPAPEKRLNMLFSATLSLRVNELAYEHMNNPTSIKVESQSLTAEAVEERVYLPANEEKIPLLIHLLKKIDPTRTLLFVNTKHAAETVAAWLRGNGFSAAVLSGDVPQKKREQLLQSFKQGDIALLVATDVAARGLHIPEVSHVINYDLPQDPEDYVHRVGRTARAGASGDAISFACETHAFSLSDIEQYIGHKIPVVSFDAASLSIPQSPQRSAESSGKSQHSRRSDGRKKVERKIPSAGPVTDSATKISGSAERGGGEEDRAAEQRLAARAQQRVVPVERENQQTESPIRSKTPAEATTKRRIPRRDRRGREIPAVG